MRELKFVENLKCYSAFEQAYNPYKGNVAALFENGAFALTNSIIRLGDYVCPKKFGFSIGRNFGIRRLVDENGERIAKTTFKKSNPYKTFIYDYDTGAIARLFAISQHYNTGEPVSSFPYPKPKSLTTSIIGFYPSFDSKPLTGAPIEYVFKDRLRTRKFAKEIELLRTIAAGVKALKYPRYTGGSAPHIMPHDFNLADTDSFAEYCESLTPFSLASLVLGEDICFKREFPYLYAR